MIIKVKKTNIKPRNITITKTFSNADFDNKTEFKVPYNLVVNGKDHYVYLITNQKDLLTLKTLMRFNNTLPSLGLKMKTGLTVDFRHKDALRNNPCERAVPLFYANHITYGKVQFPIGKNNEYIVTNRQSLLQKNTNYLFVKRFTAKEEKRRLQCAIYLAQKYPNFKQISTQNKLNFICGVKELSACIVYGLYVLFNSTLYDCYYRILNGSTQVNATEINSMPMPSLSTIEALGRALIKCKDLSSASCDKILEKYL